jgi:hypothetical protein
MKNRRDFLKNVFGASATMMAAPSLLQAQHATTSAERIRHEHNERTPSVGNVAVQTPDVADLPFTLDNGVKVFHLVAEPVKQQIVPNKTLLF